MSADLEAGRRALQSRDFAQAREHLARVEPRAPEYAIAKNLLAQIELRDGNLVAAHAHAQSSVEAQPEAAAHWYTLARTCEQLEDYQRAREASAAAVERNPEHYESWLLHGNLAMRRGACEEALAAYAPAIGLQPDRIEARVNQAAALDKLDRTDAALACFDKILELEPESPQLFLNLGRLQTKKEDYEAAIDSYSRALTLDQNFTDAWINLTTACMKAGDPDRALVAAQRTLETSPADRSATALAMIAYLQRGDQDSYRRLYAFDELIYTGRMEIPDGYTSVASFNQALAVAATEHATLIHEPFGKSTRKGYQTGNLLADDATGVFSVLRDQIARHVEHFLARPVGVPDHPYAQFVPEDCDFYMWATVLEEQGHQNPHIHPAGWVSGVYYVQVDATGGGDDQAGWIEFGRPEFDFPGVTEANLDLRRFAPQEGHLFLFPSYFFHRTVPYHGNKPRISIAFDFIPKRLRRLAPEARASATAPAGRGKVDAKLAGEAATPAESTMTDMKIETHFAVPLIEFRMPEPHKLCTELTQLFLECEEDPQRYRNEIRRSTQHGLFESHFDLFTWDNPAVKTLAQFCHTAVARVVASLSDFDQEELARLTFDYHSWFHVTRNGGFQGLHNHQNASWSGIFCVDPGEQSEERSANGVVRFHDPRAAAFMFMDAGNRALKPPFNHGAVQVTHDTGKLLVFPSHLTHEIFPYFGERPRIVVAFNCWANMRPS